MARIRIVDEWLRSPAQMGSVRARSVMVVSDTWAEQRVLMRAFAECADQLRPSIVLHGAALAIGPAGTDPHGPWGVHVDTHDDGRAQQLREGLEEAARRLAGSKGTPPRLLDEQPEFERKATNQWAPGSRRDRHSQAPIESTPAEPAVSPSTVLQGGFDLAEQDDEFERRTTGSFRAVVAPPAAPSQPVPVLPHRSVAPTPVPGPAPIYTAGPDARTIMPFGPQSFRGAAPPAAVPQRPQGWKPPQNAAPKRNRRATYPRALTPTPSTGALGKVVGRTMPLGFNLSAEERQVLNRLGNEGALAASEIGKIVGAADGVAWMESFMSKLADHGLDVVAPGEDRDGEPTYLLRT